MKKQVSESLCVMFITMAIIIGLVTGIIMIIAIWNAALGYESEIFSVKIALATGFTAVFCYAISFLIFKVLEEDENGTT